MNPSPDSTQSRTAFLWVFAWFFLILADYYFQFFTGHFWHEYAMPILRRIL